MARFTHNEAVAAEIGSWFESIVPMHERVLADFSGRTTRYRVSTEMSSKPLEIDLSAELLEAHPIVYKRGLVFNETSFSLIGARLHEALFSITRVELS